MKSEKQRIHLDKLNKILKPALGKHWKLNLEQRNKHAMFGDKNPSKRLDVRKKISFANKGEKSGHWKGGITPIHTQIRHSLEYNLWQDSVLSRDNHSCKKCGKFWSNELNLTAHHIINFSSEPKLRFAIDNGITFCRPCHKKFHLLYGVENNSVEQIQEFLS